MKGYVKLCYFWKLINSDKKFKKKKKTKIFVNNKGLEI